MKSFSKISFVCNLSFLAMVILRYIELNNKKNNIDEQVIPLPFITGILVILGQLSFFINGVFCLVVVALLISKKMIPVRRWLLAVNMIFLFLQVYYFLFT